MTVSVFVRQAEPVQRRYVTTDVFTDRAFAGNPLAIVLDAEGLTTAQMQAIAAEFNHAETTFVLPPRAAPNTARIRIFTPRVEVPFAGHPTIGTAVMLAHELEAGGHPAVGQFMFEMAAGVVPVRLLREHGTVVGAELRAPEPLAVRAMVSVGDAAACLSLPAGDLRVDVHPPQVVSVGLPFLVAELRSRDALRRARPVLSVHEQVLPPAGTDSIYAYVREGGENTLVARAFMPLDGTVEDAATGSAAAATIALLAGLRPAGPAELAWRIDQGVDMGRPSLLLGRTIRRDGIVGDVYVGGHAVRVMHGVLEGS